VYDLTPPVQVPVETVSDSPTWTFPVIAGRCVFRGAELSEMTGLGREPAVDLPSEFAAVTRTRTVLSTSADVSL
jgi:hypothetical protein